MGPRESMDKLKQVFTGRSELSRQNASLERSMKSERLSLNEKLQRYKKVRGNMLEAKKIQGHIQSELNNFNQITKNMLSKSNKRMKVISGSKSRSKIDKAIAVESEVAKFTKSKRLENAVNKLKSERRALSKSRRY